MKTSFKNIGASKKIIFGLLTLTLFTSACKKHWDDVEPVTLSGIGIVHASPGTGALDFIVDNTRANNTDFTYTKDLGYYGAYPGNHALGVTLKGDNKFIATTTTTFKPGLFYSAFVIDLLPEPKILVVEDDLKAPDTDKAKVRFINLSPDAANALDLAVLGKDAAIVTGKKYKEFSDFVTIDPSDSYTFQIKEGTTVTATLANVKIEKGKIYTLWAKGLKSKTDDTGFGLAVLTNK